MLDLEFKNEKTRKILQYEGTEIGRNKDPLIWIKYLKAYIELLTIKGYDAFVITDIRFPNEVEFIQNYREITLIVKIIGEE